MEIAGYIAALFIGISLGLIGGGGSILTVPVLVYLFGISPTFAVGYSLFIVGITSFAGAFYYYMKDLVNLKTAFTFGSASITVVFILRKFIIPSLPEVFFNFGAIKITHSLLVMIVFAILMVLAAISMIRSRKVIPEKQTAKPLMLLMYGMLIGLVTGFLGAGGGFLLIPALVIIMKLPMKEAIGTSLLIIALNSLIGFFADIGNYQIDWKFLAIISSIAFTGIFIGVFINQRIKSSRLKKGFGWFVMIMGVYIIVKELADVF